MAQYTHSKADLSTKLKLWVNSIRNSIIAINALEVVFAVSTGLAANFLTTTQWKDGGWIVTFIVSLLVYVVLKVINIVNSVKYPGSIVDELKAREELEENKKLFDRQNAVYEYIKGAVIGFNAITCKITDDDNDLCNQALKTGLNEVFANVANHSNVIFNAPLESDFTIGCYLDSYYTYPDEVSQRGVFIIKDDLDLNSCIPSDIMDIDNAQEATFEIQTSINICFNNASASETDFELSDRNYTIRTYPIYEVCCDNSIGVLFIVSQSGIEVPQDVADIIDIFNRIATNYLSRYNQCVWDRLEELRKRGNEHE
ncbi:hypothetical protein LJC45_00820 [Alistipes sp. OttesenSCG-928-B03]|nr:hypothetical protein [Alistipes sp. OttesenSCG-928-B03]